MISFHSKLSSEFYDDKWKTLLGDIDPYPVSSRKFLNEINKLKSSKKFSNLPNLNFENRLYKTDNEKAGLLLDILTETFSSQIHS